VDKRSKQHLGIDISSKKGTPVHASAAGTVIATITSDYGYGNQVVLQHEYGFVTRYAHLHSFIINKGDTIPKGKIIGFVGNSGKSTGYHLHYEIQKFDNHIDPYPFCFLNLD
jgi:murein DD-endopeptidase MepM/ murein hydrolase activator NlpD